MSEHSAPRDTPTESRPPGLSQTSLWAAALLLAVITLATYWPVVHSDFVNFDDPDYVASNPHVQHGITGDGIAWAFTTNHAGNWHPLTWVSHMVDAQLFGKGPMGPHVVNLLLHIINSILLFLLLHQLTGAHWRSAVVAAFFALHPFHVESVAWIAERKDVLSGFFFLLTLLAYVGYTKSNQSSVISDQSSAKRSATPYALALLAFACGLMSKPMLVTVPFVLLLLDFWPLRRIRISTADFTDGSRGANVQPANFSLQLFRHLLLEKLPFFALAILSSIITFIVQRQGGAVQPLTNLSLSFRLQNSLVAYLRYLGKTFWPSTLILQYPLPRHWPAALVAISVLVLASLSILALNQRRTRPFLFTGWFWFLGMMVPVIGLIQVGEQSMADRYTYLPLIGLFIMVVWAMADFLVQAESFRSVVLVATGVVLLSCIFKTRHQIGFWRNTETLFTHATVGKDNWMAYYDLAGYQDSQGKVDAAISNYRNAVALQPNFADAWNNLAVCLATKGQYTEASQCFERALQLRPDFKGAKQNLDHLRAEAARRQVASTQRRTALKARPNDVPSLNSLANELAAKGQFADAMVQYQSSLRVNPQQPEIQYGLANALLRTGRNEEALQHYRLSVQQGPNAAQVHHDFGVALGRAGLLDEAIQQFREALKLKPAEASFESTLGKALSSKGEFAEGVAHLQKASQMQPENPLTHFSLGKAYAAQGRKKEAAAEFKEALRLKPDFTQAAQAFKAMEN